MKSTWLIASILVWIAFAIVPLILGDWELAMFGQTLVYGIAAMSLAFIWGQAGLLCFGQSVFFGTGAYIAGLGTKGMLPGLPELGWSILVLSFLAGALLAGLLGAALFFGRAIQNAYFGIVTIVMAIIAERIATNWDYLGGFNGLLDVPSLSWTMGTQSFDTADPMTGYIVVLSLTFMCYIALFFIQQSRTGTVIRGISSNETRMANLGYNVGLWKTMAFSISGGVAAVAGALFAIQFSFVSPAVIGFALSTEILIWAAVGGKAVLLAAMLGAVLVKYIEYLLSDKIGQYWLLAIGVIFVVVVIIFPQGLLGKLFRPRLPHRLRR
ncbi:branched-chain amino acid ABC transporter permease [Brucella tritici]|uniref:branched-chain amino acid ABC transporter permease n=1 Tax=Brucella tritici TaxID=94626 RepID=UPI000DD70EA3|nr:branched-chain amino acid ABC transporter permease [Brucella tritici]